ncbi:MAG: leucine-rich repeat domain-containing protein [Clostridia bacterium]
MKEKNATGRHAAPPLPPPEKEKRIKPAADLRAKRRRNSVIFGFVLVLALLLIFGLSLRGAAEERRFREHLRDAESCYAAGDFEDALGHLRQAAVYEETPEMRLQMVDCYEAMGSYEKALELLRRMDLTDESIRTRIDALENKRELLRQAGKINIAGMEFDKSVSSLILRRTELGEQDLQHVAELYALSSLSLTEDGLTDLSALSGLGGLTMLDLSGNDITDLSPLASLGSLRTLYLDKNPITDFSPLYGLENLGMLSIREIELSQAQLSELAAALPQCAIHSETAVAEVRELTLGGLTFREDVTELDLSGRQLSDISAVSACRQLKKLDLSGNEISDLTPLMDLPYLEELSVADNQIVDLRPLMAMKSLQKVDASHNAIGSTAPLFALTELCELDLSENELKDLSGLASLEKLKVLNLENTHLQNEQLSCLESLGALQQLNIKDNPELTGEEVDALKRCLTGCFFETSRLVYTIEIHGVRYRQDLTVLDLGGIGEPVDLSEIGSIPALEKLSLRGDRMESIYELRSLENLRELDLSDNLISDPTPLAFLFKLEKLNLANNRITSITALLNLVQLKELDLTGNDLTAEQIEKLESTLVDCSILHD